MPRKDVMTSTFRFPPCWGILERPRASQAPRLPLKPSLASSSAVAPGWRPPSRRGAKRCRTKRPLRLANALLATETPKTPVGALVAHRVARRRRTMTSHPVRARSPNSSMTKHQKFWIRELPLAKQHASRRIPSRGTSLWHYSAYPVSGYMANPSSYRAAAEVLARWKGFATASGREQAALLIDAIDRCTRFGHEPGVGVWPNRSWGRGVPKADWAIRLQPEDRAKLEELARRHRWSLNQTVEALMVESMRDAVDDDGNITATNRAELREVTLNSSRQP